MALRTIRLSFKPESPGSVMSCTWGQAGFAGSADLEVLLRQASQNSGVEVSITTAGSLSEQLWKETLEQFLRESGLTDVTIDIQDNKAEAETIESRLRQAAQNAGGGTAQVWPELQKDSFFEATARTRAIGIVDDGTFTELLGPGDPAYSPNLAALGKVGVSDDGIVTGVGLIGKKPVFVVSMEGRFIGGALGEVGGAKMSGMLELALKAYDKALQKHPDDIDAYRPAVVISFDTGGVRLHEANAGLLSHAEIMDLFQDTKGKIPVIGLIGGKVGAFGGMGFVAAATDVIIMSPIGRMGLTGPEVIEQEMGKEEFDASDKAMVLRTTGGKHKYIIRDCNYLVADSVGDFREAVAKVLAQPYEQSIEGRRIGSAKLAEYQLELAETAVEQNFADAADLWKYFGNENPHDIPGQPVESFIETVGRRPSPDNVPSHV